MLSPSYNFHKKKLKTQHSNRMDKTFKATGLSIIYVQQLVSNSHLLLFHRAQNTVALPGNASNWNSTGYFDLIHSFRKLGENSWKRALWCHLDNVKIIDHKSLYITSRYCEDNETYWKLHCSMKTGLINICQKHSIQFPFYYLKSNQVLKMIQPGRPQNCSWSF